MGGLDQAPKFSRSKHWVWLVVLLGSGWVCPESMKRSAASSRNTPAMCHNCMCTHDCYVKITPSRPPARPLPPGPCAYRLLAVAYTYWVPAQRAAQPAPRARPYVPLARLRLCKACSHPPVAPWAPVRGNPYLRAAHYFSRLSPSTFWDGVQLGDVEQGAKARGQGGERSLRRRCGAGR